MDWSALPPLSMIRAFEAAARTGGFSAAGKELNVTHAAIAQQVRSLEERLGMALMVREGRGLKLTADGERLSQQLSEAMEGIRAAFKAAQERNAERPVVVTMTLSFASGWFMPRMRLFREAHPDVQLNIDPRSEVVDLNDGSTDVAIRHGRGHWGDLIAEPLLESQEVIVASPELAAKHKVETLRDLLTIPWIDEAGVTYWPDWMMARGIDVSGKRDIIQMPALLVKDALLSGAGAGIAGRAAYADLINSGRLVEILPSDDLRGMGYYVVRSNRPMRPGVALFIEWIKEQAAMVGERAGGTGDANRLVC